MKLRMAVLALLLGGCVHLPGEIEKRGERIERTSEHPAIKVASCIVRNSENYKQNGKALNLRAFERFVLPPATKVVVVESGAHTWAVVKVGTHGGGAWVNFFLSPYVITGSDKYVDAAMAGC